MKRPYQDQTLLENVEFFTGIEVEHTPALGCKTLFVVGVQNPQTVLQMANYHKVQQIYLGANQSFDPGNFQENTAKSDAWSEFVDAVVQGWNSWVALDFDVCHMQWVLDGCWCEYNNFVPVISVKLPYVRQLNVNAVLKIDDQDFGATNPGVWCHAVCDLTHSRAFTHWKKYTQDQIS
jgi:hypothetical protein